MVDGRARLKSNGAIAASILIASATETVSAPFGGSGDVWAPRATMSRGRSVQPAEPGAKSAGAV